MSDNDGARTPPEATGENTAGLDVNFLDELAATTASTTEARKAEGLPDDVALIVVKRGPDAGARFPLNQPVTSAGRHPNSDIFLDDVTASRRHAEFRREGGEFRIVDTGSLNGTYVNRKQVQSAVLTDGDEIQIGNFRLVFLAPRRVTDRTVEP